MLSGRLTVIGLGALAMLASMFPRKKRFQQVALWKMTVLTVWLTITGVAGTMILAYIESGKFGGTSFYGAVFLVPILILPAMLLRITYKDILNLCAPAECAMLIVMRFDCLEKGCCFGRYLPQLEIQFPSQIVEMIAAAFVMAILLRIHRKDSEIQLYPRYMLLYGILRFIMNGFRYGGTNPWVLGLSPGHFWSLVSIVLGTLWILIDKYRKKTLSI